MDVVTNANMVGVEVSVLIGRALDWAVEQCELISKDKDNLPDVSTADEMSIVPVDLRLNAFKEPINIVPDKVQLLIKRQVVDFYPCTFSMGNGPMWAGVTNAIDGGLLQLFVSFRHNPKTGRLHVLPNTLYFQKRSEIVKPEGDEGSMLTDLISNATVVSFEYTSG